MDEDLLKEQGFHPSSGLLAAVNGYALRIGERATLVKSDNARAYGVIVSLSEDELVTLYSEPSVIDYQVEMIEVQDFDGQTHVVACYVLPEKLLVGSNKLYARSLASIVEKVGLPEDYKNEILTWTKA